MSHQMSRFFSTIETLVSGLESGEIVPDCVTQSADSSHLAATAMRDGLREIGHILVQSDQRGAALCSRLWDTVLLVVQTALRTYFAEDDICVSYWLPQPEFIVGHYTADAKDRLGGYFFDKLPLDDSFCGRSLLTNQPIFVSDTSQSPLIPHELSIHVGSLVAWPVRVCSADAARKPIAALLVETRQSGVLRYDPNIFFLLESLSSLFELSYHMTAGRLTSDSLMSSPLNAVRTSNGHANENASLSK